MTTKKRISFVRDILPGMAATFCCTYTAGVVVFNLKPDQYVLVFAVAVYLYLQGRFDGAKDMAEGIDRAIVLTEGVDPNRRDG